MVGSGQWRPWQEVGGEEECEVRTFMSPVCHVAEE